MHFAPHRKLGEFVLAVGQTYARLCGEWLPFSGREELAAPAFEAYRNSLQSTPPRKIC